MKDNACIITLRKIKTKPIIITVLCFCIMAALIFASKQSIDGAVHGLNLCADVLIPSLFPFCVLSTFIIRSGVSNYAGKFLEKTGRFLFGANGSTTIVILLSMLAGYPVGAKLIHILYEQKQITKMQAQNLICCCINPGPAFIVLAVGEGIMGSKTIGYILFAANCICCIIMNIIFRSKDGIIPSSTQNPQGYTDAFVSAVSDASASIIGICAWVVLFCTLSGAATALLPSVANNIISILCEVTTAVISFRENVFLVAFCLGWCGFSVHAQVISVSGKIMPGYFKFAAMRIFFGLLLAGVTELIIKIFAITLPVSSIANTPVYSGTAASLPTAIALLCTCIIFLLSCSKKHSWKLG